MEMLCEIIQRAKNLVELDISWNELRPCDMFELIETLGKNRKLTNINLGWNGLIASPNPIAEEKDKKEQEKKQQEIMLNLGKLIKHSHKL